MFFNKVTVQGDKSYCLQISEFFKSSSNFIKFLLLCQMIKFYILTSKIKFDECTLWIKIKKWFRHKSPIPSLLRRINFHQISNFCPLCTSLQGHCGRSKYMHSTKWKIPPSPVLRIYDSSLTFDWLQNVKGISKKQLADWVEVKEILWITKILLVITNNRGLLIKSKLHSHKHNIVLNKYFRFLC